LLALEDAGYSCEGQVLNTKNYLPQNRERVFLVGHLARSERSGSQIFPIGEGTETLCEEGDGEHICSGTLSTRNQPGQAQWDGSTTLICDSAHGFGMKKTDNQNTVPTLRSNNGAASNNVIIQNTAKCLTGGGHSGGNHSDMTILNDRGVIRRLTPIECERLMGFPDNFTAGVADTNRYRVLGNSVTVPVVADIAEKILRAMV
ncbi:DNA cytosine methyltransferase, partial [bacterium]|nr:DNA cytosine methyltransferase [bacterium]